MLKARIALQQKRQDDLGDLWIGNEWGLMFASEIGTPMIPRNYQRAFDGILTKAGLPKVSLHSLRHSANTVLALLGVHPRIAMQITGCSDVRTQMRVYTKVVPESVRDVATAISNYYQPGNNGAKQSKDAPKTGATTDSATDRGREEEAA